MMEDYIGQVDTKESRKIIQDIEKEIGVCPTCGKPFDVH